MFQTGDVVQAILGVINRFHVSLSGRGAMLSIVAVTVIACFTP